MLVTNNTDSAVGIAGVSIPKRQQRTIRDWDRVKNTRRVRELLDSGSISVPSVEPEPEEPALININTATAEELQELNGVGESGAERIIVHRPFGSVDDLCDVGGIGETILERNADRITV